MPKERIAVVQEMRKTVDEPHMWRAGFDIAWGLPGAGVVVSLTQYKYGEDLTSKPTVITRKLSREEINRAIRTLRRARDHVHGKDE